MKTQFFAPGDQIRSSRYGGAGFKFKSKKQSTGQEQTVNILGIPQYKTSAPNDRKRPESPDKPRYSLQDGNVTESDIKNFYQQLIGSQQQPCLRANIDFQNDIRRLKSANQQLQFTMERISEEQKAAEEQVLAEYYQQAFQHQEASDTLRMEHQLQFLKQQQVMQMQQQNEQSDDLQSQGAVTSVLARSSREPSQQQFDTSHQQIQDSSNLQSDQLRQKQNLTSINDNQNREQREKTSDENEDYSNNNNLHTQQAMSKTMMPNQQQQTSVQANKQQKYIEGNGFGLNLSGETNSFDKTCTLLLKNKSSGSYQSGDMDAAANNNNQRETDRKTSELEQDFADSKSSQIQQQQTMQQMQKQASPRSVVMQTNLYEEHDKILAEQASVNSDDHIIEARLDQMQQNLQSTITDNVQKIIEEEEDGGSYEKIKPTTTKTTIELNKNTSKTIITVPSQPIYDLASGSEHDLQKSSSQQQMFSVQTEQAIQSTIEEEQRLQLIADTMKEHFKYGLQDNQIFGRKPLLSNKASYSDSLQRQALEQKILNTLEEQNNQVMANQFKSAQEALYRMIVKNKTQQADIISGQSADSPERHAPMQHHHANSDQYRSPLSENEVMDECNSDQMYDQEHSYMTGRIRPTLVNIGSMENVKQTFTKLQRKRIQSAVQRQISQNQDITHEQILEHMRLLEEGLEKQQIAQDDLSQQERINGLTRLVSASSGNLHQQRPQSSNMQRKASQGGGFNNLRLPIGQQAKDKQNNNKTINKISSFAPGTMHKVQFQVNPNESSMAVFKSLLDQNSSSNKDLQINNEAAILYGGQPQIYSDNLNNQSQDNTIDHLNKQQQQFHQQVAKLNEQSSPSRMQMYEQISSGGGANNDQNCEEMLENINLAANSNQQKVINLQKATSHKRVMLRGGSNPNNQQQFYKSVRATQSTKDLDEQSKLMDDNSRGRMMFTKSNQINSQKVMMTQAEQQRRSVLKKQQNRTMNLGNAQTTHNLILRPSNTGNSCVIQLSNKDLAQLAKGTKQEVSATIVGHNVRNLQESYKRTSHAEVDSTKLSSNQEGLVSVNLHKGSMNNYYNENSISQATIKHIANIHNEQSRRASQEKNRDNGSKTHSFNHNVNQMIRLLDKPVHGDMNDTLENEKSRPISQVSRKSQHLKTKTPASRSTSANAACMFNEGFNLSPSSKIARERSRQQFIGQQLSSGSVSVHKVKQAETTQYGLVPTSQILEEDMVLQGHLPINKNSSQQETKLADRSSSGSRQQNFGIKRIQTPQMISKNKGNNSTQNDLKSTQSNQQQAEKAPSLKFGTTTQDLGSEHHTTQEQQVKQSSKEKESQNIQILHTTMQQENLLSSVGGEIMSDSKQPQQQEAVKTLKEPKAFIIKSVVQKQQPTSLEPPHIQSQQQIQNQREMIPLTGQQISNQLNEVKNKKKRIKSVANPGRLRPTHVSQDNMNPSAIARNIQSSRDNCGRSKNNNQHNQQRNFTLQSLLQDKILVPVNDMENAILQASVVGVGIKKKKSSAISQSKIASTTNQEVASSANLTSNAWQENSNFVANRSQADKNKITRAEKKKQQRLQSAILGYTTTNKQQINGAQNQGATRLFSANNQATNTAVYLQTNSSARFQAAQAQHAHNTNGSSSNICTTELNANITKININGDLDLILDSRRIPMNNHLSSASVSNFEQKGSQNQQPNRFAYKSFHGTNTLQKRKSNLFNGQVRNNSLLPPQSAQPNMRPTKAL